jgi:hypothetical protein
MPVNAAAVERWVWILIYGGLLSLCVGLFAGRSDAGLGAALVVGGVVAVLSGVLLIVVRSRMKP